ncbi:MAG: hypothetical protein K5629_07115 [Eubacteriales bacterium]|nr:hypothetical protein [Eubacteriales bacterium]
MKLSAPKNVTFIISVVLVALGLVVWLGVVAAIAGYAFWLVFAGAVMIALAVLLKICKEEKTK